MRLYRARRPLRVSTYAARIDPRGFVVPGGAQRTDLFRAFRRAPGWRSYRPAVVEAWRKGRVVLVTGPEVPAPCFVEVWR